MLVGLSVQQGVHPFCLLVFHDLIHPLLPVPHFIDLLFWQDVGLNLIDSPLNLWILQFKIFVATRESIHHVVSHFIFLGGVVVVSVVLVDFEPLLLRP